VPTSPYRLPKKEPPLEAQEGVLLFYWLVLGFSVGTVEAVVV
jgi:hypothetical protein